MGDPKHLSRSHLPQVPDEEGDGSLHHPKHKSHRHRHFEEEEDRKRKHRRDETEEARKVRKRLKKEKRSSERDDEKLKVLEDEDDGVGRSELKDIGTSAHDSGRSMPARRFLRLIPSPSLPTLRNREHMTLFLRKPPLEVKPANVTAGCSIPDLLAAAPPR